MKDRSFTRKPFCSHFWCLQ